MTDDEKAAEEFMEAEAARMESSGIPNIKLPIRNDQKLLWMQGLYTGHLAGIQHERERITNLIESDEIPFPDEFSEEYRDGWTDAESWLMALITLSASKPEDEGEKE